MTGIRLLLIVLLLLRSPCLAQSGADKTQLQDLPKQFAAAWQNHDGHQLTSLMADDIDFVNVGALWLHGKADFEKYHSRLLSGRFRQSSITPIHTEVRLLRGRVGVIHWGWRIEGDRNLDRSLREPRFGLMTFIAEQRNGKWVVVVAQNTNLMPDKAPEEEGIKPKIEFPNSR